MRYGEVLSLAEAVAGMVIRIAKARHQQLLEESPSTTGSEGTVAGEVLRLVELQVSVQMADRGEPRQHDRTGGAK